MLIEARQTLRALGYIAVADLLRHLIRKSRKPPPAKRPRKDLAELWLQRQR